MEDTNLINFCPEKTHIIENISIPNKIHFLENDNKKISNNIILVKSIKSFINNLIFLFENISIYFQIKIRIHNRLIVYNIYKYNNFYEYQIT